MCQQSKLLNLSSNTFVAMSHPFVDFEHLPQVFDGVTRHIGRTLGRNSTVPPFNLAAEHNSGCNQNSLSTRDRRYTACLSTIRECNNNRITEHAPELAQARRDRFRFAMRLRHKSHFGHDLIRFFRLLSQRCITENFYGNEYQ